MNYLLDTNHWSYLQRNHSGILTRLQTLSDEDTIYMPVVSQAELLAGVTSVASDQRRQELQTLYEQVVAKAATILPITSQVTQASALWPSPPLTWYVTIAYNENETASVFYPLNPFIRCYIWPDDCLTSS